MGRGSTEVDTMLFTRAYQVGPRKHLRKEDLDLPGGGLSLGTCLISGSGVFCFNHIFIAIEWAKSVILSSLAKEKRKNQHYSYLHTVIQLTFISY